MIALTLASALTVGVVATALPYHEALANSKLSELQQQKKEIEQKKADVNSEKTSKENKVNELKKEQETLNQEIKKIDLAVADTETKIAEKEQEITFTQTEIEKLEKEIAILIERINKRNELLKNRARSFQENGKVTYLDVLLGAKSFSDFIDRVSAIALFIEADKDILRQHKEDKLQLENLQAEMEETLANLKKMKTELESMKAQLESQRKQKEALMADLKKQEETMHAEILELEEEEEILRAQEKAMEKAIELEKKRLAELAKKNKNQGVPPVSSGTFTRPAIGYISSGFGNRSLGYHYGVDIASSGTVPVVAAADGVVIRSYYSSSYGNAVFISHSINGEIYTTVYAHLRSRSVSEGEVVAKGQQIGIMGNTGYSFGQHLHFELHRGPWNASKSNAINPVGIIPF